MHDDVTCVVQREDGSADTSVAFPPDLVFVQTPKEEGFAHKGAYPKFSSSYNVPLRLTRYGLRNDACDGPRADSGQGFI